MARDASGYPVVRWHTHLATSLVALDLRLPHHDAGTGLTGRSLGTALFGGAFAYDVFDAYHAGIVTNPNAIVVGAIGAGKSTLVKMQIHRSLERGRRVVVVDPKGEYADLARSHGATPARLGVDGWCDPFGGDGEGAHLLRAIVTGSLGRPLDASHYFLLDELWRTHGRRRRVLQSCAHELAHDHLDPTRRDVHLALYRLIEGDLAGLFDGEGPPLDFGGKLVVLDVSSQWDSADFGVVAVSVVAAAQHVLGRGRPGHLVVDEAWALLGDVATLSWLRGSWKLARSRGIAHLLVVHRFGDVDAVGAAGSAARAQALGLLREADTMWLFREPVDEANEIGRALGLSDFERRHLSALPQGTTLVRYGSSRSVVRLEPDDQDRRFIDTDLAMRS